MLLNMHPSVLDSGDEAPFWEAARNVGSPIRSSGSLNLAREGAEYPRARLSPLRVDPYIPESLDPKGVFRYDLIVSNLGVATNYSKSTLRVGKLYQSAVSPENDLAQVVSVVTHDGSLFLQHVSRVPIA